MSGSRSSDEGMNYPPEEQNTPLDHIASRSQTSRDTLAANNLNEGWQQQPRGNDGDSSMSDIDNDLEDEDRAEWGEREQERQEDEEDENEEQEKVSDYSNSLQEEPLVGPPESPLGRPQIVVQEAYTQLWDFPQNPVNDPVNLTGGGPSITDGSPTHLRQPTGAIARSPSNPANIPRAQAGRGNPSPNDNPPIRGRPRSRAISGTWAAPPGLRRSSSPFGYSHTALSGPGRSQSSDLLPSSSAGPSSLSSLAASGATTPVNRGMGRSSDAFGNPQSSLSSTPISTSYMSQPRSGFLRNDSEEPSGSANPFGASPSLRRDSPAGRGRTVSPSAAADNPHIGPLGNSPWGPPPRRTSTSNLPSDRSEYSGLLPTITGSPPAQPPASPAPPPASSDPSDSSLEPLDLSDPNVAQQLFSHVHHAGVRLQHLTELITQLTTTYQSDQAVLLPALEQFSRAARDQETFTRAILTGHEARQVWQRDVDRSLRRVVRDSARFENTARGLLDLYGNLEQLMGRWEHERVAPLQHDVEVVAHLQHALQIDVHNIVVNMQRFVSSWEVERYIVQTHQQAILSQVSWMEPVAICFQFLVWFLGLFMFWRWSAAGSDGSPHGNPYSAPPPAPPRPPPRPLGGDNPGGVAHALVGNGMARLFAWFGFEVPRHGGEGGSDNAEGGGGGNNEGSVGGDRDRGGRVAEGDGNRAGGSGVRNGGGDQGGDHGGQQAGELQGAQQAAGPAGGQQGQQAEAGPGQYGSALREDGIPYQPYRRPSDPDYQPLTPLFSTAQYSSNSTEAAKQAVASTQARRRRRARERLTSFLFLLALILNIYWLLYPSSWAPTALFRRTTTPYPPNASGGPHDTKAATTPTHGAWLDAPIMKALFHAQHEAQAISALTVSSAESVLACAKLVADSQSAGATTTKTTTRLKEDWYGETAGDAQGTCRRAVRLGAEVAEKMSALAGRLEWVFGERWWGSVRSGGEGKARGTGMVGKVAARTTSGDRLMYETAMTTSVSTVTETAGWQWPRRRVPAWF